MQIALAGEINESGVYDHKEFSIPGITNGDFRGRGAGFSIDSTDSVNSNLSLSTLLRIAAVIGALMVGGIVILNSRSTSRPKAPVLTPVAVVPVPAPVEPIDTASQPKVTMGPAEIAAKWAQEDAERAAHPPKAPPPEPEPIKPRYFPKPKLPQPAELAQPAPENPQATPEPADPATPDLNALRRFQGRM